MEKASLRRWLGDRMKCASAEYTGQRRRTTGVRPWGEVAPRFGELQGAQCVWSRRRMQRGLEKLQSWEEDSHGVWWPWAFILSMMQVNKKVIESWESQGRCLESPGVESCRENLQKQRLQRKASQVGAAARKKASVSGVALQSKWACCGTRQRGEGDDSRDGLGSVQFSRSVVSDSL